MEWIKKSTGQFFRFLWEKKLWWLVPMVLVLLVLGILVMFVQNNAVVPFVYVLF
jgi:competence protein ComGC